MTYCDMSCVLKIIIFAFLKAYIGILFIKLSKTLASLVFDKALGV